MTDVPPGQALDSPDLPAIAELAARPQWVVWQYVTRDGKRTKPPYSALTHRLASSTNPRTWTDYARANLERVRRDYPGIGYVFVADDPYTGVDLDRAIDPVTGELRAWALEIIRRANTYTEVSPGGEGVKLWLRGAWGGDWSKWTLPQGAAIEVYDRERYFTVTARHLAGTPTAIGDGAALLDWLRTKPTLPGLTPRLGPVMEVPKAAKALPDAELLERMFASKHGDEVRRLWSGDCSDADGDESRADFRLLDHLLYWTEGDTLRADRLFRRSGLMRPKWDTRASADGRTYGQLSVDKSLAAHRAKHGRPSGDAPVALPPAADGGDDPYASITFADLQTLDIPEPRWLLPGLLPAVGLAFITGKTKIGKSLLLLNVSVAIGCGGMALGWEAMEQGDVLVLSLEESRALVKKRLKDILGPEGRWPERATLHTGWPRQDDPRGWEMLDAWRARSARPVMVIVDTFERVRPPARSGVNIYRSDSQDAIPWQNWARSRGLLVVVVHHNNKLKLEEGMDPFDAMSGSTGLPGIADQSLVIFRHNRVDATLYTRGRLGSEQKLALKWSDPLLCWTVAGDADELALSAERHEVLALFEERDVLSVAACAELLGIERATARKRLYRMHKDALVDRTPEGLYRKAPNVRVPQHPSKGVVSHVSPRPDGPTVPPPPSAVDKEDGEDIGDGQDTRDTTPPSAAVMTMERCKGGCGAYLTAADYVVGYCRRCGGPKEGEGEPW